MTHGLKQEISYSYPAQSSNATYNQPSLRSLAPPRFLKSATFSPRSNFSDRASATLPQGSRVKTVLSDRRTLPTEFSLISVKKYGAKGDGVTNDTVAIQRALADGRQLDQDYNGRPKALYFPAGTYVVSNTLSWKGAAVTLQGAGRGVSTIKLKNSATGFNSTTTPKAVIQSPGGNMSFRQYIQDLTVDVGQNNPGAIGIDFIASNSGAVNRVNIRSADGRGHSGLNMARQWPGPLLVKNVQVDGFDRGIYVKHAEYGPTLENITLNNQRIAGILNEGNTLAIRQLTSKNTAPAIRNTLSYGSVIVLNGSFQGGSSTNSAIVNNGYLYARNIAAQGYKSAITNKSSVVAGLSKTSYVSDKTFSLFSSPQRSLTLPIEVTPSYEDTDLTRWAKFTPRYYGDIGTLQSTLNSGKSTVYFPFGTYFSYGKTVVNVPASVQRIVGFSSVVNTGPDGGITFRVTGNSTKPLIIEQFGYGVSVEHASARTVVMKHGKYSYTDSAQAGKLFLEDVELPSLNINSPHSVWARQLNIEGPQTKITNNGGNLWILGLKTEGTGTVINTTRGGKTELLGTVIYPATAFTAQELEQKPAFINNESSHSLIYSLSSYIPNGNYKIQVRETRDGVTRNLFSNDLGGLRMPLFTGFKG